ncbi:alanine racemase [Pontibacter akesuensis]|uniref:Alanine racemase n=1 Tax=Pontibacter akesuensis TaxID=388950 RepID=A0A1I7G796_9BACT|nr:alanine racemase [Pontibacter akesuensis]GHA58385.1 alanine racemase [Pontibacter akesuensis]SFU44339.1 alanine racemase [Pontibacter akesuensis]
MFHSSYIEISKSALQNNIAFIKQLIGQQVQFSSVIKGNAYGHGIEQFTSIAQESGVDHFSVFSADEAQRVLQTVSAPTTIMIMGYIDNQELEWAVAHGIEFYVFEMSRLEEAAGVAKRIGKRTRIHLELETGMNRTGFEGETLARAEAALEKHKDFLELKGLCTHFAGAESIQNHDRVMAQQEKFQQLTQRLQRKGHIPVQRHTACSAAMVAYPHTHMDMVRIGIMQYGFWPSPETYGQYMAQQQDKTDPLRRLINWKSRVMSLKTVQHGEYIGYGTSYQAPRKMTLAIVPVGYSWGYSRSLSNVGNVLIKGMRASVVGIVNMNVMMVDVTDIPGVAKDEEVVLLGRQGNESITVASFGELSTQLNYELLTRLPVNIPRIIVA